MCSNRSLLAVVSAVAGLCGSASASPYISGRIALGYGHFDYDGFDEDGIRYPPQTAGGALLGVGFSYAVPVSPTWRIGATASFEPLLAPRGEDELGAPLSAEPAMMPNGSAGILFAWSAQPKLAIELAASVGGGGVVGLPGGVGLLFQGAVLLPWYRAERFGVGPSVRLTWGPLMADVVRGGSIQYVAIDIGVAFANL